MAHVNYTDSCQELVDIGLEIIGDEYPALIEHQVDVRFRLSKKAPNLESDNYWGETRLINNIAAYEANREAVKTAKLNPPTFVCICCMKWQPERQRHQITLGIDKYNFCISGAQGLNEEQRDNPDEKFLAQMQKRQEKVQTKEAAGYPEYDAFFTILMYKDVWEEADDEARRAMVSTQLARCGSNRNEEGELILSIIKPPIKLFPCVIEKHGTSWWKRLDEVAKTIRRQGQLTLLDTTTEETSKGKGRQKAG